MRSRICVDNPQWRSFAEYIWLGLTRLENTIGVSKIKVKMLNIVFNIMIIEIFLKLNYTVKQMLFKTTGNMNSEIEAILFLTFIYILY